MNLMIPECLFEKIYFNGQGIKYRILALRTDVIEKPLLTSVSAIQPPILAKTAIVNHGSTHRSPDSVRLNFKTCQGRVESMSLHHISLAL